MAGKVSERDDDAKAKALPVIECSPQHLAEAFGVNVRSITNYANDGLCVRTGRGSYDFTASVRNYINELRASAERMAGEGGADLKAEQTRLTSARADKVQLELTILRGDAVLMPDVEALVSEEYGALRLALSQISGGVARELAHETDPAACQVIVADAIEAALTNLTADKPNGRKPKTRHLPGAEDLDDEN